MAGGYARWGGIAGCVLLTACFKLNPDFEEAGGSGGATAGDAGTVSAGSDAATDSMTDSATGSTTGGLDGRVTEGLRLLYVFDEQACQTPGQVSAAVGSSSIVVNPGCARCEASALVIDGVCESAMNTGESVELSLGTTFTLEAWILPTADEDANLLGQDGVFSLVTDATRRVMLRPTITGSGPPIVMGTAERRDEQPWHLAVISDGSTLRVFIDRSQEDESSSPIPLEVSGPLQVGGISNRNWSGSIHLLAVYDKALSYAEYCQNHEASPWSTGECP